MADAHSLARPVNNKTTPSVSPFTAQFLNKSYVDAANKNIKDAVKCAVEQSIVKQKLNDRKYHVVAM